MNKRIFQYHDGESDVFADPSELEYQIDRLEIQELLFPKRLAELPADEEGMIDFEKIDPQDRKLLFDSYHEAEPLIREAFKLKPFDRASGKGLLYREVIELYNKYLDWCEQVKKNTETPPPSVESTA